jgi:hypothetical protein
MGVESKVAARFALFLAIVCFRVAAVAQSIPNGAAIDAEVGRIVTHTHSKGMAVAVIARFSATPKAHQCFIRSRRLVPRLRMLKVQFLGAPICANGSSFYFSRC